MKTLLFAILFCLLASPILAQTSVQLILKNDDAQKIGKVYMSVFLQDEFFEADWKDTLTFQFKKEHVDFYQIQCKKGDTKHTCQVWLDTGHITILSHVKGSKIAIDTVLNAPVYYKWLQIKKQALMLRERKDTVALNNFLLEAYQEHIDDPLSLFIGDCYIGYNRASKTALRRLKALTDQQGDKFKEHPFYSTVNEPLEKLLTIYKINWPEYSFISRGNKAVKMAFKEDKIYIFDFWNLGCAPCRKDHIEIKKLLPQFEKKGVEFVGISTDQTTAQWKKYLSKHGYQWPNYVQSPQTPLSKDLGVVGYPSYIIIDREGNIVERLVGMKAILEKYGINP
jgi:thiol-disulfide isomerase/thioredoxin